MMLTSVPSRTTRARPKRNGEVGTGIGRSVIRLAIQMFVFEEEHRIVAADRRAKQAAEIERGRRHHHADSRRVREQHFAALAVIDALRP